MTQNTLILLDYFAGTILVALPLGVDIPLYVRHEVVVVRWRGQSLAFIDLH